MSQLTYSIPSARLFRTCLRTHHQLTIPNALTTCYTSQLNTSTEHIESEIIRILAVKSRRFEELKSDEDVQEAALASERYALLNSVKVSCHMASIQNFRNIPENFEHQFMSILCQFYDMSICNAAPLFSMNIQHQSVKNSRHGALDLAGGRLRPPHCLQANAGRQSRRLKAAPGFMSR